MLGEESTISPRPPDARGCPTSPLSPALRPVLSPQRLQLRPEPLYPPCLRTPTRPALHALLRLISLQAPTTTLLINSVPAERESPRWRSSAASPGRGQAHAPEPTARFSQGAACGEGNDRLGGHSPGQPAARSPRAICGTPPVPPANRRVPAPTWNPPRDPLTPDHANLTYLRVAAAAGFRQAHRPSNTVPPSGAASPIGRDTPPSARRPMAYGGREGAGPSADAGCWRHLWALPVAGSRELPSNAPYAGSEG